MKVLYVSVFFPTELMYNLADVSHVLSTFQFIAHAENLALSVAIVNFASHLS